MLTLNKPEKIMPFLISIMSCYLIYISNTSGISIDFFSNHFILEHLISENSFLNQNVHLINKITAITTIFYLLYIYIKCFADSPLLISGMILFYSVFYMAIIADKLPTLPADFFILIFLTIIIWHALFLRSHSLINVIQSSIILSIIALLNPIFAIFLAFSLIICTYTYNCMNKDNVISYQVISVIILCGFCSFTASIIACDLIPEFLTQLQSYVIFSSCVMAAFIFLTVVTNVINAPIFLALKKDFSIVFAANGLLIYVGFLFIGRYDYIAHFV